MNYGYEMDRDYERTPTATATIEGLGGVTLAEEVKVILEDSTPIAYAEVDPMGQE